MSSDGRRGAEMTAYDDLVAKGAAAILASFEGNSAADWSDEARAALDAASVPALLAVAEAATEWAAAHATTDLSPYTDPDPLTYRRAWQRLANADADLLDALRAYQESDDDVTLVVP